jgi:hypothetical protein
MTARRHVQDHTARGVSTSDFANHSKQLCGRHEPSRRCDLHDRRPRPAVGERPARSDQMLIDTSEGPYGSPLARRGALHAQQPPVLPPSTSELRGSVVGGARGRRESGWGLTLGHQDDVIFVAWYTYDGSGKPWWLSMTATPHGSRPQYAGTSVPDERSSRWRRFRSTADRSSARRYGNGIRSPSATAATVLSPTRSAACLAVEADSHAWFFGQMPTCTFGWTGCNMALATNYQGTWWSAGGGQNPGGASISRTRATNIFAGWFTYDYRRHADVAVGDGGEDGERRLQRNGVTGPTAPRTTR